MAQLKDTVVIGNLRVTGSTFTDTIQASTIKSSTVTCLTNSTTFNQGALPTATYSSGTLTFTAGTLPTFTPATETVLKGTAI